MTATLRDRLAALLGTDVYLADLVWDTYTPAGVITWMHAWDATTDDGRQHMRGALMHDA